MKPCEVCGREDQVYLIKSGEEPVAKVGEICQQLKAVPLWYFLLLLDTKGGPQGLTREEKRFTSWRGDHYIALSEITQEWLASPIPGREN